jgi:hypothetical protein
MTFEAQRRDTCYSGACGSDSAQRADSPSVPVEVDRANDRSGGKRPLASPQDLTLVKEEVRIACPA